MGFADPAVAPGPRWNLLKGAPWAGPGHLALTSPPGGLLAAPTPRGLVQRLPPCPAQEALPAPGLVPQPRGCFRGSTHSGRRHLSQWPLFSLPVLWIHPVGPFALSLAAELLTGRAGAAGAAGRGQGLPPAVFPGAAAAEGGRLVSGEEARPHVPPPAGERGVDPPQPLRRGLGV